MKRIKKYLLGLFPPEFRKNPAHFQGLTLAVSYTIIALTQLFTYEDFAEVTSAFGLPGGEVMAVTLAVVLPLATVASLPFLLSMKIDRRIRQVSRISTIVMPALWMAISLWTNITGHTEVGAGIFGATLYMPNGWWFIGFTAVLLWAAVLMFRAIPERKK